VAVAEQPETRCCDECGSDYLVATSQMASLCPECAHWLYGYSQCPHEFSGGRCSRCGWDGSVSAYLRKMPSQRVTAVDRGAGATDNPGEVGLPPAAIECGRSAKEGKKRGTQLFSGPA
jgi:hypothetical protein